MLLQVGEEDGEFWGDAARGQRPSVQFLDSHLLITRKFAGSHAWEWKLGKIKAPPTANGRERSVAPSGTPSGTY